jgi:hypothetical protein
LKPLNRCVPILASLVTMSAVLASGCGDTPSATLDAPPLVDVAPDLDSPADTTPTCAPWDPAAPVAPNAVGAGVIASRAGLIGGPKAEGIIGDIKIANSRVAFVIEGLRRAGGYRQHGGTVVDADLANGGEDRLGELWFIWNFKVFEPTSVAVTADGCDGRAEVVVRGRLGPYAWLESVVGDLFAASAVDLDVTYTYTLTPDADALAVDIRLENRADTEAYLEFPLIAANMGDGAPLYTRGAGLDAPSGDPQPWLGAVGMTRSYALIPRDVADRPRTLVQVTSVQLSTLPEAVIPPRGSRTFRLALAVAPGGSSPIERLARGLGGGDATGEVRVTVEGEAGWGEGELPPSNTAGRTRVVASRDGFIGAIDPVGPDGAVTLALPPGRWTLQAFAPGRGASEPMEVEAFGAPVAGDPAAGAPLPAPTLVLPSLGEVRLRVRDGEGAFIPSQVQLFREGDTPSPFGPPATRYEPDWGRERSAVAFVVDPEATLHLLPGTYLAVASRGYGYEIDSQRVTVSPGLTETLSFELVRAVDDSGWSAADLHLHSFWSPDADVPYPTRLLQAAANDVALPVFTEHTNVGPLAPARAEAGVDAWVTPIPGQEVSTTQYGHFNAYPLAFQQDAPAFGAVFEHGRPGTELFDAIRAQRPEDLIVQVNHPRIEGTAMAWFNAAGLDTDVVDGEPYRVAEPSRWTEDWDVLEVFNEGCAGDDNRKTWMDWVALYDRGVRKTVAGGSDSHSEGAGLGHPRTWIAVSREAVAASDLAIVAPLAGRAAFVSCGPFLRFSATSPGSPPVGMGGLARPAEGGEVRLAGVVEAPSWMRVDTVRLLERGVVVAAEVDIAAWNASERPAGLRAGVRWQGEFAVRPQRDSWYVLEVAGSGGLSWVTPWADPYAVTNPIDVDADGDGVWTPPGLAAAKADTASRNPAAGPAKAARRHHHHDRPGHAHPHHGGAHHGHAVGARGGPAPAFGPRGGAQEHSHETGTGRVLPELTRALLQSRLDAERARRVEAARR